MGIDCKLLFKQNRHVHIEGQSQDPGKDLVLRERRDTYVKRSPNDLDDIITWT